MHIILNILGLDARTFVVSGIIEFFMYQEKSWNIYKMNLFAIRGYDIIRLYDMSRETQIHIVWYDDGIDDKTLTI